MWIAMIIMAIMFLVLAIVFLNGKGAFLIAGYNTASQEEKDSYDEKALCKFMGKVMVFYSFTSLIMATSDLFKSLIPFWIGMGLFFAGTIYTLIYANTNNRFKKQ